ncbi:winged helix-turn-helix domain-containing protein, partial [Escherichia coli]
RLRLAAEPQTGRREVSALTDARKTLAYDFFRILRAPLIKPFDFTELVARVRTLLRRARSQAATVCTIADMTVDMVRRTVIRSGKKIHLTGKEYVLLELLLQRTGEVLPRSLISSLVWNMNFDSDTNVIDVAVRRLRSKIDDDFEPKLIHTVRGAGYVLEIREE